MASNAFRMPHLRCDLAVQECGPAPGRFSHGGESCFFRRACCRARDRTKQRRQGMRRGLVGLVMIWASAWLASCLGGNAAFHATTPRADETPSATPSAAPPPAAVVPTPHVTYLGRVQSLDPNAPDHVVLSWAGVAAGVHFNGTQVVAQFLALDDLPTPPTAGGTPEVSWFNVWIDGNQTSSFALGATAQNVPVASNLTPGEHTLWLNKRTEASVGVANFNGFALPDGGNFLSLPPRPKRHIEVIGASTEVGFGALGQDCNSYDAPNFEDEQLAWGHVAASNLAAEESDLSFSGYGLLVTGNGPVAVGYSMQDFFLETDPFRLHQPWDFASNPVDAVLFNLGANDFDYYGAALPQTAFEGAFVSFIQSAIAKYPQAQIYVLLSPTNGSTMNAVLGPYYQDVVKTLQSMGYMQVHYFAFTPFSGGGCYGHPLPAQHAQMASAIAAQLRADLGW